MRTVDEITARIRPRRPVEGISAVLMPFSSGQGRPDFDAFAAHVARTARAGLVPAVNMDTGYVHALSAKQRGEVLQVTRQTLRGGPFVAGVFVEGEQGDLVARYRRGIEAVRAAGGTPILFQCTELSALPGYEVVEVYRRAAAGTERVLAFELGRQFAPFGCIYDLETVQGILEIEAIGGLKHSSLDRRLEWQRLALRDRVRPGFQIYTGNDLAIDMVMYGSDYLLGLSTFAPEAFALRDRFWAEGDSRFYPLNDLLQYLGFFAFRPPTPAYRHSAAQFLHLAGALPAADPPPGSPRRPESDRPVLADILARIREWLDGAL